MAKKQFNETKTFAYLEPYTRPESYIGETFYGYYPFLGQSRDSDCAEKSNFATGLARLGGESEVTCDCKLDRWDVYCADHPPKVIVARASHWAVGWVETIYIHGDATELLERADDMLTYIHESYPLLDEDDVSEREWSEASDYWETCGLRERIEIIHRAYPDDELAFLSARFNFGDLIHDHDPDGRIYEYINRA